MPIVTVLVFIGQHAPLLPEALDSLAMQTFQDFDVVLIGHLPASATRKALRRFEGRVALTKSIFGPGQSLPDNSTCSPRITGDWVAFLQAEDIWYPHKLDVQLDFANRHPDLEVLFSEVDLRKPDGTLHLVGVIGLEDFVIQNRLFPISSTILVKCCCYERNGRFEFPVESDPDRQRYFTMMQESRLYGLPFSLVQLRHGIESPSSGSTVNVSSRATVVEQWWTQLRHEPERRALLQPLFAEYAATQARRCWEIGDFLGARTHYRLALSWGPWSWKYARRMVSSYLPGFRDGSRRKRQTPKVF